MVTESCQTQKRGIRCPPINWYRKRRYGKQQPSTQDDVSRQCRDHCCNSHRSDGHAGHNHHRLPESTTPDRQDPRHENHTNGESSERGANQADGDGSGARGCRVCGPSGTTADGIGFGLGWAVVIDPVKARVLTSARECHWGGAASTFFFVDPGEDLFAVLLTQLMPSSTYPLRRELRTRIYQAIVD